MKGMLLVSVGYRQLLTWSPPFVNFLMVLDHSRNPQPVSIVIQLANQLIKGTEVGGELLK